MDKIRKVISGGAAAAGLLIGGATAGPADTDWVDLFNGKDFTGLYVYNHDDGRHTYDSTLDGNNLFKPVAGEIRVASSGGQRGHVATKRDFSHFHMKVDWKIAGGNCGIMYHLREDLALQNPGVRLYDVFPPSIEAQGEKGSGGDCWVISNVWMDTKVSGGRYSPTGTLTTFGGVTVGGRNISASAHYDLYGADNPTGWNTQEVIAYGADSVLHIVNGKPVFRGWNLQYTPGNAPTGSNPPKPPFTKVPFDHGRLSLQAEMSTVAYRNWKVADLVGCKDAKATNYKSYYAKHRPEACTYTSAVAAPRVRPAAVPRFSARKRDALGRRPLETKGNRK